MERGRIGIGGLGVEIIAMALFVLWDDPPEIILSALVIFGAVMIVSSLFWSRTVAIASALRKTTVSFAPPETSDTDRVISQIDSAAMHILLTQNAIDATTKLNPPERLAPFSPPPHATGTYGSLSNQDARHAFVRLQSLGVIQPTGARDERGQLIYEFTRLGDAVRARV